MRGYFEFFSSLLQVKFEFAFHTSGSIYGILMFATHVCFGWQLKLYSLEGFDGGNVGG